MEEFKVFVIFEMVGFCCIYLVEIWDRYFDILV